MVIRSVLALAIFTLSQEITANSQTEKPVNHLSVEYDASSFRLELVPGQCDPEKPLEDCEIILRAGDDISFQLLVTNISIQPVTVPMRNTLLMNRPELYRDGQLVPYRAGLSEKLERGANFPGARKDLAYLESNKRRMLESIWLKYWYDQLQPGHYQLTVKHRFFGTDQWMETEPITFDVQPRKRLRSRLWRPDLVWERESQC